MELQQVDDHLFDDLDSYILVDLISLQKDRFLLEIIIVVNLSPSLLWVIQNIKISDDTKWT